MNKLVATATGHLPTVSSTRELRRMAEQIAEANRRIYVRSGYRIEEELRFWPSAEKCQDLITQIEGDLTTVKQFDKAAIAIGIADQEAKATEEEVGKHLTILIGSFPNATKADLSLYGAMMCSDIVDLSPSPQAVEMACQKLRTTCEFLPPIATVFAAVSEAQAKVTGIGQGLDTENTIKRLEDVKVKVLQHIESIERNQREREERARLASLPENQFRPPVNRP